MSRHLICLSFRGTAYAGWQIQPNALSVEEIVEEKISKILRQEIKITGCGRTDSGVHAHRFYAHFDTEALPYPTSEILNKLNRMLPADIAIQKLSKIKTDGHARFSAIARTYRYYITSCKDPFRTDLCWQYPYALPDIQLMNAACRLMIPYSDFGCFTKKGSAVTDTTSKLYSANWTNLGDDIVFEVRAIRFLRNMVRAMTGTLIEVGKNRMTLEQFQAVLDSRNRCEAGDSVPAHGLYLWEVEYPKEMYL